MAERGAIRPVSQASTSRIIGCQTDPLPERSVGTQLSKDTTKTHVRSRDSISQYSTSMRMPTGHSQQVPWEILPLNWPSLKRRNGDTASNEGKLSRHSAMCCP
ncbi:hypothetical protein PFLUV_G00079330 [Perca fluviatilis]|uniref:Uncharacterized protein n=1 Tax=Perca fluviatilis TaxID=8168 RepID=A0A6A5EZG3_PERFL|nr:hypothetical protein PFLUV_G00079330 [Perca fluviatilis]